MRIKLVAIDMDDTLLRSDKTYDDKKLRPIFRELKNRGIKICIASGNDYPKLMDYIQDEEMQENIYFAADNGNDIRKNGEQLQAIGVTSRDMEKIEKLMADYSEFHPLVSTDYNTYVTDVPDEIESVFAVYRESWEYLETFQDVPKDENITNVAIYSQHSLSKIKEMMYYLREELEDATAVTSEDEWISVYNEAGGKGQVIEQLQEKYNISMDETIAFGDSLNDLDMMKNVTYSVAMANADEDLKEYCHYEIGTNEEQAVLDILSQYLEEDSLAFLEKYKYHK